jgi:polyphosphate glucokinase
MKALGIDVGGSGIKGTIVDLNRGELVTDRIRYVTPKHARPRAVALKIAKIASKLEWRGEIGVGFPAAIKNNVALSASNIAQSWIGTDAGEVISKATGSKVTLLNDADAAAIAEFEYGGQKDTQGLVIFITIGTGLGTAFINNGVLVPNLELGHLYLKNKGDAEWYASNAARKRNNHSWKVWARRFNHYLDAMESLFQPDQFVIGGGVSKRPELFMEYISVNTPIRMAALKNEAGIIGAARAARGLKRH